jgi:heme/copper-type cytochrome/quinol oxidase subunit 4
VKLPAEAIQGSQSGWFCNAWIIEKDLKKKYMIGFIISSILNAILFWMVIK